MTDDHVSHGDESEWLECKRHLRKTVRARQSDSKMPSTSDAKTVQSTTPPTERPLHYTYLKEFRVEQCPLFQQHKCTQHKPFTCFYWHFMNQRRRRPVRKRDGTFNYSPDVYCSKYDETTGVCPDGDECLFLHRTAGDTERRYHLRYYKTGICVYDTDNRGYCVKNGPHCAFAHGVHDLRTPVFDARETQAVENSEDGANGTAGLNSLDKDRNALNEDPKWQDANYVLANYKTEPCKRPPRLCRQGYACPQYHNNRDRRRSPKKFKYRSTPCPNVKQGDEWGDPANCESSDSCPYCHTRTEQQFHPEIYKSTKCNDIIQAGYCPRGPFCAFAHVDKELCAFRESNVDHTTDLATILSNALPSPTNNSSQGQQQQQQQCSSKDNLKNEQGSGDDQLACASSKPNSLPEGQVSDHFSVSSHPLPNPISRPRSYSSSTNHSGESAPHYPKAPGSEREDREAALRRQLQAIDDDSALDSLEKARRKQNAFLSGDINLGHMSSPTLTSMKTMSPLATSFYPAADTVESVVGNALDDLSLDDINVEASLNRELINDSVSVSSPLPSGLPSSGLLGASAPMNIPCTGNMRENRTLSNLSPVGSPIGSLSHSLQLGSSLSQVDHLDKAAAAFYGHSGSFSNSKFAYQTSSMYEFANPQNMSPSRLGGTPQSLVSSMAAFSSMGSPSSLSEMQRLREEIASNRVKIPWEDGLLQSRSSFQTYEVWKRECEEACRRERVAEQQRDEAVSKANELQKELEALKGGSYFRGSTKVSELETLPKTKLKQLQEQLREDLGRIDKVIFYQSTSMCMICEKQQRSVTVVPCSHYILCNQCAPHQKNCPYCNEEITSLSNINASL